MVKVLDIQYICITHKVDLAFPGLKISILLNTDIIYTSEAALSLPDLHVHLQLIDQISSSEAV